MPSENRNAPELWGWAVAAGLGLFAFGVAFVPMGWAFMSAAFLAAAVFLIAGLVMGMPSGRVDVAEAEAKAEVAAPGARFGGAAASLGEGAEGEAVAPAAAPAPVAAPAPAAEAAPALAAEAVAPEPVAEPVAVSSGGPLRLDAPRGGKADNLKEIEGIGPALEKLCNSLGFWHFDQIANWSEADVAWVDANMKTFKGRIQRDRWVVQAKLIVTEGLEAFRERAKTNNY